MLCHCILKGSNCVVADFLKVSQSSSQNVDSFDTLLGLDPKMHFVLLWVGNGVTAEADVRTEMKGGTLLSFSEMSEMSERGLDTRLDTRLDVVK